MQNKAFTLAEILIALTIIGFISIVMIKNIKMADLKEDTNSAKAFKVLEVFDEASTNIRDTAYCPMGKFIYKDVDDYELGLKIAQDMNVLDMYSEFVKFEKRYDSFCDYTGYSDCNGTIPAAKIPGDIYIGIEQLDEVSDCPDYYMPDNPTKIEVLENPIEGKKPQCWAKLYVDTNGKEEPNTLGKDVFIFGIGEYAVHH